ncbi:peroxiredoxin [Psychromarinibacter sp. C21-152]|uniref:Glutathione-dependent peroxiredoxin n=1 Tax=Psychromarinibacter sediminicola TaxID=3033385 RepID=A0AAE3NXK5_9RHOB|nr:peroxiredoxin [Psychromarinibacter sediminicola]MDF0603479.1 peroxiredoxin [Psychromarinibacter sediminicola]
MGLEVGARYPEATVLTLGPEGPEQVDLGEKLKGRKVVLFALPGAFTRGCSTVHMPSFVRTAEQLRDKGVDEVICLSVNDPFTLAAWARDTGADAAGITMLADAEGKVTHALGQAFSAPPIGLIGRSNRYAVVIEDGVITHVNADKPGECDLSTGERMLEVL